MKQGEEKRVFTFIQGVFNQFVAPEFSQDGVEEFMKYIQPDVLSGHLKSNLFALVAASGSEIVGVIAVRDYNHVALFFVDHRRQRRGIGKELFKKALEICIHHDAKTPKITVNASPNAIDAYKVLNFEPTDSEQCVNGIRFVPMTLRLQRTEGG